MGCAKILVSQFTVVALLIIAESKRVKGDVDFISLIKDGKKATLFFSSKNDTNNNISNIYSNSYNKSHDSNNNYNYGNSLSVKATICIALFAIVLIFGVIGNSLVVHVYRSSTSQRFLKFEKLMLILGTVDLISSITNPLLYIYQINVNYRQWHFGSFGCNIISGIGPISTNISLGIILIMSIDRYRAVIAPFKKQFTEITIYKASGFTMLLSIIVVSPYMYFQKLQNGVCTIDHELLIPYSKYALTVFITSDIIFFIVLSITTMRIFYKLNTADIESHCFPRDLRMKETQRILKTIFAMGIAFIVLIFPRDILQIIYLYSYLHHTNVRIPDPLFINAVTKVLQTANSCVNVFLYSVLNKRFRRYVIKMLMKSKFLRKLSGYKEPDYTLSESRYAPKRSLIAANGTLLHASNQQKAVKL